MKRCRHCEEEILPEEEAPAGSGLHAECCFRLVAGSLDHILRGPHEPGACAPDAPGLTRREAARAAREAWHVMFGAEQAEGVM